MIGRKIAKLNMTPQEAALYRPPPGINVIWLEWMPSKKAVVAEFVASDAQPDPILRKSAKDITHELGTSLRHRVIEELESYNRSPRRAMRVEALLNHPMLSDAPRDVKRHVESATDVHEVRMTKQQAEAIAPGKRGVRIDPKEIRYERSEGVNSTSEQEVYVYEMGEIDSG
jgi:hypothetical protein